MSRRLTQKEQIEALTDEFLATGETVENIRDIWYRIKGEALEIENNSSKWDKTVNSIIGTHLWELFLAGDKEIYSRLNILTKGLEAAGELPLVVFSEKTTRATSSICRNLRAGRYSSQGQIPSFEIVHLANYMVRHSVNDMAFLVGIVDYDPAGLAIWESLVERLELAIKVLSPDTMFMAKLVSYGDSYEAITSKYDTYELSNDKINYSWREKENRPLGVEMNVVFDKAELLEETILKTLAPWAVKPLSLQLAKESKLWDLESENEEISSLQTQIEEVRSQLKEEIEDMEATFDKEWVRPIGYFSLGSMTTLA